ncbi:MAG: orotate phosphoribosyltransferase [Myxococcota bacterium]
MEPLRQRLLELLRARSWRRGAVVLSSGKTSSFYIDSKQTTLHAEGAAVVGRLVFSRIQAMRESGVEIRAAGGLTLGADPIAVATAVTSHAAGSPIDAFVIRKEPKEHGTAAWIEGGDALVAGSPVVILEDVVTTGASTLRAVERARAAGLVVTCVIALVDREEGGAEAIRAAGLRFESLLQRHDFETSERR